MAGCNGRVVGRAGGDGVVQQALSASETARSAICQDCCALISCPLSFQLLGRNHHVRQVSTDDAVLQAALDLKKIEER